jgi:agmatinase
MAEIRRLAAEHLDSGIRLLFLGGDHSVSFPLISAYAQKYKGLSVVHLDAHADLYHDFEGNPHSHASPFARLMEEGAVAKLIQIGIRTMTRHLREQAKKFGIEIIEMRQLKDTIYLHFDGPVYISLDMDCLDPAFAPGVSHHEPGGMTTRQVLEIIQGFRGKLVGADIVEYNPLRDFNNVTAMTAGKFYKELVARLIRDST